MTHEEKLIIAFKKEIEENDKPVAIHWRMWRQFGFAFLPPEQQLPYDHQKALKLREAEAEVEEFEGV